MPAVPRVFAALKASKQVPLFITLCHVILDKMTGNAACPIPPVPLSVAADHLSDLENAERLALHGPRGAAQDRNFKLGIVRTDFRQLKEYVTAVAQAVGAAEGAAIIESAGFCVSRKPEKAKPPFAARYGKIPGSVLLEVKSSGRGTTYYWQVSSADGPWSSLPDTRLASTTVDGLTAGTLYHFRYRTLTRAGVSAWSMVVGILAH